MTVDPLIEARDNFGVSCGDCGAPMVLRRRRADGKPFWACSTWPKCSGTHGAHPNGKPLGVPADKETRQARIDAHRVFDAAWKARGMSRDEAYTWLQEITGKSKRGAHISKFTAGECRWLIRRLSLAEAVRQCLLDAEVDA